MPRNIIHVDMDAFYASVEQLDHPEYRGRPLVVGSPAESRGVVSAASYEARQFGLHSAMAMGEAVRRCPEVIIMPVRMDRYSELSDQIREVFHRITRRVEPLSIDEAFLDVSQCVGPLGTVEDIGRKIQQMIRDETQLTASVGMAPNKFLAKLASDLEEPNGFVVITEANKQAILDTLAVGKIWGIGKVTCQTLRDHHIETIQQLRLEDPDHLAMILGNRAGELQQLARGIDSRPVVTDSPAKSISSEHTFSQDIGDFELLRQNLYSQVQEVARRLRDGHLKGRTLTLKFRYGTFRTVTRSKTLSESTHTTAVLWQVALAMLKTFEKSATGPLRLIGFGVSGFTDATAGQQMLFADPQEEKEKKIDATLDAIQKKFGSDALRRGE
ncbi:MAG: DNA polymerase IV [Phycisphaerae bacterium]|nr:DNA polymerase IV [Phycisphaerae bacterium]